MKNISLCVVIGLCIWLSPVAGAETADEAEVKATVAASVAAAAQDASAFKAIAVGYDPDLVDAMWDMLGASLELNAVGAAQFAASTKRHPTGIVTADALLQAATQKLKNTAIHIDGDVATLQLNGRPITVRRVDGKWLLDVAQTHAKPPAAQERVILRGMHLMATQFRDMSREVTAGTYPDWIAVSRALDAKSLTALQNDPEIAGGWKEAFGNIPIGPEMLVKWMAGKPASITPANQPQANPPPVATGTPATQAVAHDDDMAGVEAKKSEMFGANGGGPFTKSGTGGAPITAIRYLLGRWNNRPCIQHFDPVFEGTEKDLPALTKDVKVVTARKGYVLGGLNVDADTSSVLAFKAIFVRYKNGRVDPTDQYTTDWTGTPGGKRQQKLDAKGDKVIGIFGRQGLNVAALGLLLDTNLTRTARVGGNGGSPFSEIGENNAMVVGFRYAPGNWTGPVIRKLDPIFENKRSELDTIGEEKVILAKDGYVVGGVLADTDDTNTIAVKVTFVRRKGDGIDASDSYISDWIGTPSGIRQVQLAGHGEKVVGTFGRKGINLDGFGLLVTSNEPVKKPAAK